MTTRDRHAAERFDALDRGGSPASRLFVRLLMASVLAIGAWIAYRAFNADRGNERLVQTVELLGPAPPPREPEPPPEELLPEETEVEVQAPLEQPDLPGAIDDRLGVDGDATGVGDGFGLVSKRGGRDITELEGSGRDGNGNLSQAAIWFAGALRADIERKLAAYSGLRDQRYVVVVKLWIDPKGVLQDFQIPQPPASRELQAALETALASMRRVTPPPAGLPQPVWLRITSSTGS